MIEYTLLYSERKTLTLHIEEDGSLTVKAPLSLSKKEIEKFILEKEQWILKTRKRVQEKPPYPTDEASLLKLKEKAMELLPELVEKYSRQMKVKPRQIKLNTAKKRFGSCSSGGNINFSIYLMLYPERAVEYVVVHELAHLKYMNHSKKFYAYIEKFMPDYKERIRLLK